MASASALTLVRHTSIGGRFIVSGLVLLTVGVCPWLLNVADAVEPAPFAITAIMGLVLALGGVWLICTTRLAICVVDRVLILRGPVSIRRVKLAEWAFWRRPVVIPLDSIREVHSLECLSVGPHPAPGNVERYLLVWADEAMPSVIAEGLSKEETRALGAEVARFSGSAFVERIQVGSG